MFDKVVTLVKGAQTYEDMIEDAIGQQSENVDPILNEVFADFFSISQNEYFKAGQHGFKPVVGVLVLNDDYQGEEELTIDEDSFHVYRVFNRGEGVLELYCEVRV